MVYFEVYYNNIPKIIWNIYEIFKGLKVSFIITLISPS